MSPDIPELAPVDEDSTGFFLARDPTALGIERDDVAVLRQEHALRRDTEALGDAGVGNKLSPLPMNGNEVTRAHQVQHELELFRASVTRDVHRCLRGKNDVRFSSVKVIDDPRHRTPVTWDDSSGEHHGVLRFDECVLVIIDGNLRQSGKRFALAPGGEDE